MKDADSGVSRGGQRVALPGLALLLAALYLAAAVSSARRKSATFDETAHLAAGISYWKTGDFRMNPEHPPLVKLIAGAFALAGGGVRFEPRRASDGAILAAWEDGEQYTFGSWLLFRENDGPRLLFRARLAMILIGLSGLAAAAGWARELARGAGGGAGAAGRRSRRGAWAALAAAAFLAFYPEYTGHARWVTFDVPAAAACAGASLLFWRWFRRPSPGRAAAFLGVAVAGALAKLTALLFLAPLAAGGAAAAWILARRRGAGGGAAHKSLFRRRGFGAQAALWGAFALALWAGAWAVYGFRFTLTAPDQPALARTPEFLSFRDSAPERQGFVNHIARALWRARLAPEAAIAVLQHTQTFGGRQAFLRGRMSREGFPDYFFWTVLYKTPLLYLALGAFAFFEAARALWRRRGNNAPPSKRERLRRMGAGLFLAWPFLALFALSAASRVNLGHRYIVFIYIPWCVALGLLCARWGAPPSPRWQRAAALLAPAAAAAIFLAAWPDYATWFNRLAGRSSWEAARLLQDSNVDWGQDLPALAARAKARGWRSLNLAYFGSADPRAYGVPPCRWILPSYPFAVNAPPFEPPDFSLPTAVSLYNLPSVQALYPGHFERAPDAILNSIVVFEPAAAAPSAP